ncbi:MAG: class II aldolase/adducin family protein [Sedimentisphaerales bacterium]|nr:class II aldolase/adducin family protein [Sedimentisphaerales bacterium]
MKKLNQSNQQLKQIVELSHRFGTNEFVRGGGGNTSAKNDMILWVKPSGVTLSSLNSESFLAMDRKILSSLYTIEPPTDPAQREILIKDKMAEAVLPQTPGRASVEAPLHSSLGARFVVHTHPAIVNGMTCSQQGPAACKELFDDALWIDYIDPGYTLCMKVRQEILKYQAEKGHEPEIIFLKNHGVFVAADDPERIGAIYDDIMTKLRTHYAQANVSTTLKVEPCPSDAELEPAKKKISDALQNDRLSIDTCGAFDVANGPLSPDHIVYSKSYALVEQPTRKAVEIFRDKHGYLPLVFAFDKAVFAAAETETKASLALELAQDGALVKQLAQAFGGIEYMTHRASEFIENWEVESYRSKQIK